MTQSLVFHALGLYPEHLEGDVREVHTRLFQKAHLAAMWRTDQKRQPWKQGRSPFTRG